MHYLSNRGPVSDKLYQHDSRGAEKSDSFPQMEDASFGAERFLISAQFIKLKKSGFIMQTNKNEKYFLKYE